MRQNILVVNDDGIEAKGIHKLAEALSEAGDVYVCSPHIEKSSSGHALTIGKFVYFEEVPFAEAKRAVSMEGSPADCTRLGIEYYRNQGIDIDMVFSGVNHGVNLGSDTLYSGTVSAAVEGAMRGLPSAAISVSINPSRSRVPENFETAMKMATQVAKSDMFLKHKSEKIEDLDVNFIHKEHVILNVNVPALPPEEIKGVKVCPLSFRAYDEWFHEKKNEEGRTGYCYSGMAKVNGEAEADESDIVANWLGYVTITPLCFDLTKRDALGAWRYAEWEL